MATSVFALCLSAASNTVPRSDYTAVEPLQNSILQKNTNLTRYQRLERHVLLRQIDVSGGRRGCGWGGVIPTKTWLWSVLIERKNVLADRPFQPGRLEVLERAREIQIAKYFDCWVFSLCRLRALLRCYGGPAPL